MELTVDLALTGSLVAEGPFSRLCHVNYLGNRRAMIQVPGAHYGEYFITYVDFEKRKPDFVRDSRTGKVVMDSVAGNGFSPYFYNVDYCGKNIGLFRLELY